MAPESNVVMRVIHFSEKHESEQFIFEFQRIYLYYCMVQFK